MQKEEDEEEEPVGTPALGKENGRASQRPAAGQKRSIDTAGASASGGPVPKRCVLIHLHIQRTIASSWQVEQQQSFCEPCAPPRENVAALDHTFSEHSMP